MDPAMACAFIRDSRYPRLVPGDGTLRYGARRTQVGFKVRGKLLWKGPLLLEQEPIGVEVSKKPNRPQNITSKYHYRRRREIAAPSL